MNEAAILAVAAADDRAFDEKRICVLGKLNIFDSQFLKGRICAAGPERPFVALNYVKRSVCLHVG